MPLLFKAAIACAPCEGGSLEINLWVADKTEQTAPLGMSLDTVIGADAANYLLVQPTGVTANITPLTLTLGSLVASDKVYDGTASAAVTGSLSGVFGGDAVSLASLTGSFRDKKDRKSVV